MRTLVARVLTARRVATGAILLVRSLVKLKQGELRLIESRIDGSFGLIVVLDFDDGALATLPSMLDQFTDAEDATTEIALAYWIGALYRLVPYLVLLKQPGSATFAHNRHKVAVVKLMSTQKQLIVCELVRAALIVALETNLIQVVLLDLVELLK